MENQDVVKAAEFCANELLKENESLMLVFSEGLKVRLQEAFIKGYFKGQNDLINRKFKL